MKKASSSSSSNSQEREVSDSKVGHPASCNATEGITKQMIEQWIDATSSSASSDDCTTQSAEMKSTEDEMAMKSTDDEILSNDDLETEAELDEKEYEDQKRREDMDESDGMSRQDSEQQRKRIRELSDSIDRKLFEYKEMKHLEGQRKKESNIELIQLFHAAGYTDEEIEQLNPYNISSETSSVSSLKVVVKSSAKLCGDHTRQLSH